jgi:hypothetical protein
MENETAEAERERRRLFACSLGSLERARERERLSACSLSLSPCVRVTNEVLAAC